MNKVGHGHRMEDYSAFKRQERLTHAPTWITLEDIMLRKTSQSQKNQHCRIHFYGVARTVKFRETESKRMIARGCEERGIES